ncbi:MAG: triphosphoribosyl-dephospho-CoA synthase [Pirellulaceae bacterium]
MTAEPRQTGDDQSSRTTDVDVRRPSPADCVSKPLSIGRCATLACLLEAIAAKPGNVHRGADFEDLTFADFAVSAAAIGPVMENAAGAGVGETALAAVRATRQLVETNTNLGIVLLLAPLAAVPRDRGLREGVGEVLRALTPGDSQRIYEAIRHAQAGGMGRVDEMDIADKPPADVLVAMQAAAERDLVARQYANRFEEVFRLVVPWLEEGGRSGSPLTTNIVHTHVRLLAEIPDSLIARKCGAATAREASARAAKVLAAGAPDDDVESDYYLALGELDFWLRSDGHRRNPGTTADLVTAGLFCALRDNVVRPPFR